jgi:hypothetical protein
MKRMLPGERDIEETRLLVRLGCEAGGWIDPSRIASRPPDSPSALAYEDAIARHWITGDGCVTPLGFQECER